ncbi:LysM peptidoglycan-binding domain-containing protein [Microbacterium sp. NPDC056569]|uniref:LysM peptidoglycan-binding domain-containing protein n=1 Tax=Microbacterium sp. NPDC056569 TaxID=3345867 RepID=UPI00366A5E54
MTAIDFTTSVPSPARAAGAAAHRASRAVAGRSTRLRLTVRGRRVLAALAALPAVIALTVAVMGGGAALASRDAGAPVGSFRTVTVAAGESLWAIAEEVAPAHDPRDVVDAIVRLNALDTVLVQAGQRLAIPAAYDDGR